MKTIDVQEQPILGLRRTVQITANGIRYRLFRSLVTVVVVAVAVAFLMNIVSESLVKRAIGQRTRDRIAELRAAATWSSRLTDAGTLEGILAALARARPGGPAWTEAQAIGALSDGELTALHGAATTATALLGFVDGLDYARRRALVHNATGTAIFDRLQAAEDRARFDAALKRLRSVRVPLAPDTLEAFIAAWPASKALASRLQAGRRKATGAILAALGGRPILEALAEADGAFAHAIRQAGFVLPPEEARRVAAQARRTLEMRRLEKSIADPDVRKTVAGRLDMLPADVNVRTLWRLARSRHLAEWYLGIQPEGSGLADITAGRAVELAEVESERRALTRAERLQMDVVAGGLLGIGTRMTWLVVASMLVCVVGISNAMLMSVTERFREIATLKCLGALDGFIMLMFVLEACVLGVVGGLVGALLGSLLGLGRMVAGFGSLVGAALPAGQIVAAMGIATVLGVVLAAIAAVYPSFKAARLAPMEAMRIQ